MKNKVIYITGGTKGIGYGIAEVLLKNGYSVAISGRELSSVKEAEKELAKISDKIIGVVSSVKNIDDEKNAVKTIIEKFGKIDGVIANAGVGVFENIEDLSVEDWHHMIDTNLTGVFYSLKASLEQLKENQGYFISISSLAGTNFFEKGTGYNASKFGVVGFTQAAMLDLRKYNIKVSTIMPGSVSTHFNGHTPNENDCWKIQPRDIGEIVLGLLEMNPRTLLSKIEVRPTKPN